MASRGETRDRVDIAVDDVNVGGKVHRMIRATVTVGDNGSMVTGSLG